MANPTDHLTAVRAALDLAAKATTGPWAAEDGSTKWGDDHDLWSMVRDGAGSVICDMFESGRRTHRQISADAAAIVALRNAAPAIAALADECERLRARIAKAEEVVAAARTLGSYAWTDRLDDSRTSDDAKEDESKLSSAVWQYDNPPNLHPDGCHTTAASAFRDCSGDGHHECRTCTRFDEREHAKGGGELRATRGPIGEG